MILGRSNHTDIAGDGCALRLSQVSGHLIVGLLSNLIHVLLSMHLGQGIQSTFLGAKRRLSHSALGRQRPYRILRAPFATTNLIELLLDLGRVFRS